MNLRIGIPAAVLKKPFVMLRSQRALLAGFVAQALQYGSALLMLPFLVSRLNTAEVGLWYLFVAIQALTLIADFGFQPTFARSFALAHAGAKELQEQGIAPAAEKGSPNWRLFSTIVRVSRQVYLYLSIALFAVLSTVGLWYINYVAGAEGLDTWEVGRSWIIFSTGVCMSVYFLWVTPVLIGLDRVGTNYRYLIIARGGFALAGIGVLLAGGGLTSLALTLIAADLVGRASVWPALRPALAQARAHIVDREYARAVLRMLLPNAWRTGVVGVSAFLILKANAFVVTPYLGLAAMATFGVTAQLVSGLSQVALLPMQVTLPKMIAAHYRRDRDFLRRTWLRVMTGFVVIFVTGALVLVLFGDWALGLIGSQVALIPRIPLLLLCLVALLEGNHTIAAVLIQSSNRVPFVRSALLSGIAVLALTILAAREGLGLLGIILAQGLVQASYNNWRWPVLVYKELRA